ncbi:MAG: MFS transporter [Spirochaetales bacterium]|nr:MFS transporter [Spirochaetales bacterium]
MEGAKRKLSLTTRICYAMGDLYGGGAFNIINFYYALFLTDVVKISPSYSAMVFLISKVWDALTDPFMGYFSDRTHTRWGRRRPYFLAGIPLIFISFVMLWQPVAYDSEFSRFLYILLAYMFFNTVFTLVMVPYQAMSAELTSDYEERTSLNALRIVFSLVSSLTVALVPLMIINAFGGSVEGIRKGYVAMSIVFGLFFALPWIGTFLFTYEEPPENRPAPSALFKTMTEPLRLSIFRKYLAIQLFTFIAFDVVVLIFGHYMKYWIKNYEAFNIVMGVLIITQVLVVPVYTKISHRRGKTTAYITGAVIWGVASFILFFVQPESALWGLYAIAGLMGAGLAGVIVIPYTMFGDVVDAGELYFGENRSGSFSGMLTFLRKSTTAIAQSTLLALLGIIGYREPVEEMREGILVSLEQPQTEGVLLVIRLMLTLVPIILLGLTVVIALKYPLTKKIQEEIRSVLEGREKSVSENLEKKQDLIDLLV